MRPPSVYANLSCPAGCPCEVTGPLYGPSRRGPPGHDLAVPSRLDRGRHRRVAGLRSVHGAPPDPPLQPARGGRAWRPAPTGTATPGQPQAWRPHPPAADPAQGVDDRSADQRLGRPAPSPRALRPRGSGGASRGGGRLGARGDPDRDGVLAELHQQLAELPAGTVVLAEDETHV